MKTDVIFAELQKQHQQMRELEKGLSAEEKRQKHQVFAETAKEIIGMGNIARREGLLALEEAAWGLPEEKVLLKKVIMYIADGTDPEWLLEISLAKYFSMEQDACQAISNLMTILGMSYVQQGLNPRMLNEILENIIPEDVVGDMYNNENQSRADKKNYVVSGEEQLCNGNIRVREKEEGYKEILRCDNLIKKLSDRGLQKVLDKIRKRTLNQVARGISGEARRSLFKNLSTNNTHELVKYLLEEKKENMQEYLEEKWEIREVAEAAREVNVVIDYLKYEGEIYVIEN